MFNWFCWRKDFFTSKPVYTPANPSIAATAITTKLDASIAETRELSSRIIKKLEEAVEDREQLLAEVFNSIEGFLILKGPQGEWKLLNTYGKELFGIKDGIYKGLFNSDISVISPVFKSLKSRATDTDIMAWESKASITFEERMLDDNGRELIYEVNKIPIFDEEGNKKYLLVHGINVTEEFENTKHITMLVKALDQASDSIIVTDHLHKIIYANQAYINCTGYTLKEILGQHANFISTIDSDIKVNLKETIIRGEVWQGSIINKHKDGTKVEGVLTITPVLNGKPYPIYYIGVKRLTNKEKQ